MGQLKLPSNTRANFDARVAANALVDGRTYWITDDDTFVIATGVNTYKEISDTTLVVTANRTVRNRQCIIGNTAAGALVFTLLAAPVEGDWIEAGRIGANTVTIARNGKNIAGLAENLVLDTDLTIVRLTYISGAWRITSARSII